MPTRKESLGCHPGRVRLAIWLWFAVLASGCTAKPSPPVKTPSPEQSNSTPQVTKSEANSDPSSAEAKLSQFQFRDATEEWKFDFVRFDDKQGKNLIQESTGGGVAIFDYDLDGRLDVFMTQGSRLPRKSVTQEFSNEMFRNTDRLQKVTLPAGLTSFGYHTGATVGDIDEDGFPDLYVTAYGRTSLWHNNGDGTFSDISTPSKTVIDSWSSSAALADFNDDGLLDLFVCRYLQAEDDPPKICAAPGSPTGTKQCSPALFSALDDVLFINDGQGGFVNFTRDAGINGRDGKGLGVVATDIDNDGHLDIYVANDGTLCFLYRRKADPVVVEGVRVPQFEECAAEYGVAQNGTGMATAAMGVAHGDYNRDGWIDLFVTNFYLEQHTLYRNLQGHGFLDTSTASRLGPVSRLTLAFGTEFFDGDHDGWLDLIVTTGHIEDRSWAGQEPYQMRPHLFRNDRNSKFTDVAEAAGPYFRSRWVGRGLALGDLDRDGDLDIIISHQVSPSALLLNESAPSGESIIIRPVGDGNSPRSGIGSRVVAKGVSPVLMRDIGGGGSFQSASALELHLGLSGRSEIEEVEFRWPDGHVDRWRGVKPGYYVAVQGQDLYRVSQ